MSTVLKNFRINRAAVTKLVSFDRDVLDFLATSLREQVQRAKNAGVTNRFQSGENLLQIVESLHRNASFRPRYETVFNQAVVLLVSHFASSVHDLFLNTVRARLASGGDEKLHKEELTFSVETLCEPGFDAREAIPDMLVQTNDISWQDMQSIARAFGKYFGLTIERDADVNDIITAQACRHVIVHWGGMVNDRTLKMTAGALPRKLKPKLTIGQKVQFQPAEIEVAGAAMERYLDRVARLCDG